MTEPVPHQALDEALDRLWKQFQPQIEDRLAAIESAARALTSGELIEVQRDAAHAAAHKLAGVLGTFGLTKGTILAREAEVLFSRDADPATASQISEIAAQLRTLVAQHQ
jgi:HPt (histidine-containing phosphotransfer) domain-containing protein